MGGGGIGNCLGGNDKDGFRIAASEGLTLLDFEKNTVVRTLVFFTAYSCKLFSKGALSHRIITEP